MIFVDPGSFSFLFNLRFSSIFDWFFYISSLGGFSFLETWNAWLRGRIRKKVFKHSKLGLEKVHVRMGEKLRKKVEDSYQQFFFYFFLFPFLYICSHSRDTPTSFAFTALDRMDGLGLGVFL